MIIESFFFTQTNTQRHQEANIATTTTTKIYDKRFTSQIKLCLLAASLSLFVPSLSPSVRPHYYSHCAYPSIYNHKSSKETLLTNQSRCVCTYPPLSPLLCVLSLSNRSLMHTHNIFIYLCVCFMRLCLFASPICVCVCMYTFSLYVRRVV